MYLLVLLERVDVRPELRELLRDDLHTLLRLGGGKKLIKIRQTILNNRQNALNIQ